MALDGACAESKGKAVVVESSDDEEGLWGYGNAVSDDEGVPAEKEGPISIEDDDDDDGGAAAGQKRKLDDDDDILVLGDSDDDEEERKKRKRGSSAAVSKKKVAEDDGDEWLDEEGPSSSSRANATVVLDPGIQEMLRKNSEAMQSLERASKEAAVTMGDLEEEEDDDEVVITEEEPRPSGAQGGGGTSAAAPDDAVELVEKVQLCVRCDQNKEIQLRMTKTDPFKKLMDAFRRQAAEKGWLKAADAPIKFIFDGEPLPPTSTPAALDCDDGDVIDAHC